VSDRIARLLRPRSIAVVGASPSMNKLAGQLIPTLLAGGFKGAIHPVNPRYEEVAGLRCYAGLDAVPGEIDHCVIVVGRERVAEVMAICRRRSVGSASIFSSGFAEAGEDGIRAQQALVEMAGDMTFIGPNCMGFANLADGVLATTSSLVRSDPTPGDIAVLSQSGGIAFASLGFQARAMGLRFSHMINTGNSAGVSYTDLVAFLFGEDQARVIVVAAESEAVVAQVLEAVRRHGLRKPIVLLKLGRGATGVRMALSHTGSLAGDYRLVQGCAEQAGIVCADDVDEALGAAELLRHGFGPEHAGGLASVCISGGNIALFADHADRAGLPFAPLTAETERVLHDALPDYISVHNPIDITALGLEQPALHAAVLRIAAQDPTVKALVPILTSAVDYTPVCTMLAGVRAEGGAPMIALWTGGSMEDRSPEILRAAGIPIFRSSGLLARCLAQLGRARIAPAADVPMPGTAEPPPVDATEAEAFAYLQRAGIPVPAFATCDRAGLAAAAETVGYPLVIKVDTAETHISDRGGVILDVRGPAELSALAPRIAALPGERLVVLRYLPGEELIVSVFTHPQFGRLLMLGSGGRMVEAQPDVRFLRLPAGPETVAAALAETMAGRILKVGRRGATGFDAAVDLACRVAGLALAAGDALRQIELNPVTVGRHGAVAVDAALVAGAAA
jgi:acyl-CoA synthetase (NDP forming)